MNDILTEAALQVPALCILGVIVKLFLDYNRRTEERREKADQERQDHLERHEAMMAERYGRALASNTEAMSENTKMLGALGEVLRRQAG